MSSDESAEATIDWIDNGGSSADLPGAGMSLIKGSTALSRYAETKATGVLQYAPKAQLEKDLGLTEEGAGADQTAAGQSLIEGRLTPSARKELAEQDIQIATGTSVGHIKDTISQNVANKAGIDYDTVNATVHQWAQSSNDQSVRSLTIQADAAREFAGRGVKMSDFQQERLGALLKERGWQESNPQARHARSEADQRKILRTMYDQTQATSIAA